MSLPVKTVVQINEVLFSRFTLNERTKFSFEIYKNVIEILGIPGAGYMITENIQHIVGFQTIRDTKISIGNALMNCTH